MYFDISSWPCFQEPEGLPPLLVTRNCAGRGGRANRLMGRAILIGGLSFRLGGQVDSRLSPRTRGGSKGVNRGTSKSPSRLVGGDDLSRSLALNIR
jgi:hypothetical protein